MKQVLLKMNILLIFLLSSIAFADTVKCGDKKVGSTFTIRDNIYLVVEDGDGKYGIKNESILSKLEQGDLRVCTSHVTSMFSLFADSSFNQPIGDWDVSNVTNMKYMFSVSNFGDQNTAFNQPIGDWDTSNVTDMRYMFGSEKRYYHSEFNQPLDNWDVSNVENMESMFKGSDFNQPLNNWNVTNVIDMRAMFKYSKFNQPLNKWNSYKNIENCKENKRLTDEMFAYNKDFNQDLSSWNCGSNTIDLFSTAWTKAKPKNVSNIVNKDDLQSPSLFGFGNHDQASASCYSAFIDKEYNDIIKECKYYVDVDMMAREAYALALYIKGEYTEAMPYLLTVKAPKDEISSIDMLIGTIYYFDLAEPKYPQDEGKGIKYIQKASDEGLVDATKMLKQLKLLKEGKISSLSLKYLVLKNGNPLKKCLDSDTKEALKECKPFLKKSKYARYKYGKSLFVEKRYLESVPYIKEEMSDDNPITKADGYQMMSNICYFGLAEPKYPEDKAKGLAYLTKAANLGNDFAQNQLGDFYNSNDKFPGLNVAQSYKWYTLASANGNAQADKSGLMSVIDSVTKQAPYCIAMGEQLVAQAYIDGSAGLSKDTSKAKKYLNDAIALYKDNEPTKDSYKYCSKQKDLNLENAEKLYKSL
ncbi:BspA family leucine-rich repeat surface protein [Francisella philomiragia]|uniref:BspA family leucine-rich repeat surface protein n=1 Tax=Francisella philomiragia TaxID=28110 RepID=UPI0019073600|nr:BspA family leucine-rich repeat surface protein [Francisella philomiragia]MBK2268377.1 BspA family leucine-rich repeat surface protein [Francisella philomiragia]MBK2279847.1 BspA family leucine-rich repeat surface protein [Francisella philomiragia]MBK2287695.1 BspA family leucine-rich repeat surface protein [Francisella philomiragia]MBK2289688.1 BspA family leucine-rich repeat surface protein [Francisella philomiragia]MBK2291662.1 BspA family leucine-rich repeat surface protein [Francisella